MSEIENLHIKELKIDNYKSLKHSTIELQSGLNIIIGKNGAGKSNLLEFISVYATRPIHNLFPRFSRFFSSNFFVSYKYFQDNIENIVSYSIDKIRSSDASTDNEYGSSYEVNFNKFENGENIIIDKKFIGTRKDFRTSFANQNEFFIDFARILRPFEKLYITYNVPHKSSLISQPNRLTIDEYNEIDFEDYTDFTFFQNLQFTFEKYFFLEVEDTVKLKKDHILLKERVLFFIDRQIEISGLINTLSLNTPIKKVRLNSNINIFTKEDTIIIENIFIEFLVEDDWLPWSYLSDGTKRLFYLISECLSTKEGLVLIEEPELGIHPHQFYKVLDFLHEQAQTKQVIISTHSPMALDILKPNELDRIIIAKYDKGTKFLKLTKKQIVTAKKYMKEVGELSYYWLHSDLEND